MSHEPGAGDADCAAQLAAQRAVYERMLADERTAANRDVARIADDLAAAVAARAHAEDEALAARSKAEAVVRAVRAQAEEDVRAAREAVRRSVSLLAQLELEKLNVEDALERTSAELASTLGSRSWKLTAPLRAVMGKFRSGRKPA